MKKFFTAVALLGALSMSVPAAMAVDPSGEPNTNAVAEGTATLRVKVVVDGKPPALPKIDGSRDAFCAPLQLVSDRLVVGQGGELKNFALILDAKRTKADLPKEFEVPKVKLDLDNKNCMFEPHVLVVQAGQTITVLNSDQTGHNANFSFFNNDQVNVLVPIAGKKDVTVKKDERTPIPVECNIHPWMKAYVIVTEHPFVGVSNEDGVLEIKGLPAGEVTLKAWHESTEGAMDEVVLNGKKAKWSRGNWEVTLKPGMNDLGEIKIPASKLKVN